MERLDPASATTTMEWRPISTRYAIADLCGWVIGAIIVGGVGVGLFLVMSRTGAWQWVIFALLIATATSFLLAACWAPARARAIGYALRDDDLVARRGIMFLRLVAVPYGRMQLVDITRGPIERMLGLATLKLVTAAASTQCTIPGLPLTDAEALRDHLVRLAESRRAGL